MKIVVDDDWILHRIAGIVIAISLICILQGIYRVEVGILPIIIIAMVIRSVGHEFIHAFAVCLSGGITDRIQLGPGSIRFIDFSVIKTRRAGIYFAGFAFDTVMILFVAYLYYTSPAIGNVPAILLKTFAGGMILLLVLVNSAEKSDFRNMVRCLHE